MAILVIEFEVDESGAPLRSREVSDGKVMARMTPEQRRRVHDAARIHVLAEREVRARERMRLAAGTKPGRS